MHEKFRHRALGWWAGLIARRPWWTLLITLTLAVASTLLSTFYLGFQSNRNELVSRSLTWNRWFIDWQESFPGSHDLWVVVDTRTGPDDPDPEQAAKAQTAMDEIGQQLAKSPYVDLAHGGVVWRFGHAATSPRAMRLLPMEQYQQTLMQLEQSGPVLRSRTPGEFLGTVQSQLQATQRQGGQMAERDAVQAIDRLQLVVEAMGQALQAPAGQLPALSTLMLPRGAGEGAQPWTYLTSDNGRFYFMRITPAEDPSLLNAIEPAIAGIRQVIAQVEPQYPSLDIGLTGIEVVEADETEAAIRDAAVASTVAFILITGMLILAYHSVRTPLLAMGALLVGLSWAFGFTTLAIGHLQVLSVIFATMLLGISDAYGVHIATRYELIRHDYPDTIEGFTQTLRECYEAMGPGIITGAVTTAAAFMTTVFTDFKGVAEMGLISGVGILLCLLAMFSVYPALIRIFKPFHRNLVPLEDRWVRFYKDSWVMPFVRHPVLTLVVATLLTGASLLAVSRMRFDYDLLKLQPKRVESVDWARRIAELGGQSIHSGSSIAANLEEARRRTEQFRKLPTVERVAGIAILFPEDEVRKLALLRDVRERLGLDAAAAGPASQPQTAPSTAPAGDFLSQLQAMRLALGLAAVREMPTEVRAALGRLSAAMDRVLAVAAPWTPQERVQRLEQLQQAFAAWQETIRKALDPSPLQPGDLPAEILRPYMASNPADSRVVVEVFPKLPDRRTTGIDSALHPRFLPRFIRDLKSVDPAVTGVVRQIYESGDIIKWSYIKAGIYALLVVFAVVWFDFRSLSWATLSLAPVAIGFAVTFGVMWLAGMSINPANILVLPLMFGIGVDSGVHILHRYRLDRTTRPLGLTQGTGKAITITALTTIIGFATMIFAHHRGIASLGFVLTVGLTLTLAACLTVMPACLELWQRKKQRSPRTDI